MKFENPGSPEIMQETLATIALTEYHSLPPETKEWLQINEDVPDMMWEKLTDLDSSMRIIDVLQKI